jgi:CSLREA domain-containing protein
MSCKLLLALLLVITVGLPLEHNVQALSSTFTVNSMGDAPDSDTTDGICDDGTGACTLRAAIEQANATPGTDTMAFNISGAGPHTISPGSALPTITDPVIIDGYTQPGASPNTLAIGDNALLLVELNGASAGAVADGLSITAGNSTVKGLVINRWGAGTWGHGIDLSTNGGDAIEGSFIGTDVTGTADLGNNLEGVYIRGVANNTIGGTTAAQRNVISGNGARGLHISGSGATGNLVQGNYIGTDVTGTSRLGNSDIGVAIRAGASDNTVGGTAAGARNVISANHSEGVRIGEDAQANQVQGNYIGTDASGTADLGNSRDGLEIWTANNTIGGSAPGAGNVISGNGWSGLWILWGATGNQVQGNYIGTDVTGTSALGNFYHGVYILGAPSNNIGGTTPGEGNVISGNGTNGVYIASGGATGNQVQGNYIGTDKNDIAHLGNSEHGVYVDGAPGNTIGGTNEGEDNVIAYNGSDGVRVDGATAIYNTIRANSIHSNVGKGIENISGGNTELAPPVVTSAGSASGTACANCQVDVFSDNADEGRTYHGSTTASGSGNWTLSGAVTGPKITATATDASGNTSEFSAPFTLPAVGGIAELPALAGTSAEEGAVATEGSGWSAGGYAALVGGLAAAALASAAGACYARRRWLR